ncbi:MAG: nucleotidyltransferase family protein [Anaerolineae bacterium]|nr:nucleotidyltransferase family protein [Anaerolineae bacterium]
MDAIITAGGMCAPDDPLYQLTGVEKKALIPLVGKPMISWVVDAVWRSGLVEHIAVVGLKSGDVDFGEARVDYADPKSDIISNVLTGLDKLREINPLVKKILLVSSDIPLITPDIVRGFVAECGSQEADGYYAIVEEKTMEARFPGSKRTFVPFKGARYTGGDMLLLDINAAKANEELLRALSGSRKNYWNQARMLGLGFILRFIFRTMTVEEAAARARKQLAVNAQVVDTRYAEVGMDLDKPRHYELIKAVLEAREGQAV